MVALVLLAPLGAVTAFAGPKSCDKRNNNTFKKLLECVALEGVRGHQAAFQAIADANGGTRHSGSPGYDASAAYVANLLAEAGYNVTIQPFDVPVYYELGPSTLEQTAPGSVAYVQDVDFNVMTETDPGDVTALVTAVDLDLGLGNTSTSGCEAADFAGFPAGHIALVQRGACTFQSKAENAAAAGAFGVIIFNQGNTTDRTGLISGTLSTNYSGGIPVQFATYARGEEWSMTPGLEMHMTTNVFRGTAPTSNVLAESTWGDPNSVVMVGAHLDSFTGSPGINDNGSGSAAILEVAIKMRKVKPRNMVRFAWWGGAAQGAIGSNYYLNNLSAEELDAIGLYLNIDIIGSPNYVRFVIDGDGSDSFPGPPGSEDIEALFEGFFAERDLEIEPTPIGTTIDEVPFFVAGIPLGGLFTGTFGIKTPEQVAIYGGTAGEQYDPCASLACDTNDNVSLEVLDVNSDAAAYAVLHYAMSPAP
jgi:Zn-dependent M28 family amino/carboxypeptidase